MRKYTFRGSLYKQKDRWYWKVKLPGESARRTIPLRKPGVEFATRQLSAAKEIAQNIWDRAVSNQENPGRIETIGELVNRYLSVVEKMHPETSNQPEDIKRSIALLDEMSEMLLVPL
jgi:hypothetical protein